MNRGLLIPPAQSHPPPAETLSFLERRSLFSTELKMKLESDLWLLPNVDLQILSVPRQGRGDTEGDKFTPVLKYGSFLHCT